MNQQSLSSFIWSVADLLRGDYKQSEYGKVILPFTVLRRLDCVLESTKAAVLAEHAARKKQGLNAEPFLIRKAKQSFYNASPLDMKKLMGDQDHIRENLFAYLQAFSPAVRDIFEHFEFYTQIDRLAKAGLLYLVTERFAQVDLHPAKVTNSQMGLVFEELIRKFAEISNETAGEHFTPREVIRLMVNLLFIEDDDVLANPGVVRTIYDPTAGTGGMLSVAGEYLAAHNPQARLTMSGQELNPESYAICKADMLIKGQDVANIVFGNTFSDDGHPHKKFDYMLSNPPFGVEWKKVEKEIRKEHESQGFNGRFGPGLPRVSDGSLLFLLHLLSKMRPAKDGGSRFGIVLNGSPLFTGGAGSGESEIRRYVLENDLVEAIIGLPTDMFYNTGISTYVWILSNRKPGHRAGRVQLIDASAMWQKMRKSLGSKRKELSEEHIAEITRLFGKFLEVSDGKTPISRIFKNSEFGYRTITVERPLRDEKGKLVLCEKGKLKGKLQPDASLRDTENVPLSEDVEVYFKREVLPHARDAWIDHEKTKVGYEIPFNRYKRAASICYGIGEPPKYRAEGTPLIRATNVHNGRLLEEGLVFVDPADIPAQRIVWLSAGDIVVVRSGAYAGDSAIIPERYGPCIAGFDMVLRCAGVFPSFAEYALLSKYLKIDQIDLERMRAAQPHLNAEELGGCLMVLPNSVDEQAGIALFLDRETAKIDELIAGQQRLKELLKEKRLAVISRAVTKGLNPSAPMKDSGVEGLGRVPEHWGVTTLKRFSTLQRGHDLTDAERTVGRYPVVTSGGVSGTHGSFMAHGPGVVTGRYGSTGRLFYIEGDFWPHNTSLYVVDFHGNNPKFVWYSLQTVDFAAHSAKAAVPGIDRNDIHVLPVTVPPKDEQPAIADYLDRSMAKLDELTAEAERAISLLQERRTALISAAVTGKIDVRGVAGSQPTKEAAA